MGQTIGIAVKMPVMKVDIRSHTVRVLEEEVAVEAPVNLFANGEHVATLLATPSQIKELVLGYFVDEGLVRGVEDVLNVQVDGTNVRVAIRAETMLRVRAATTTRVITTSCGSIDHFLRLLDRVEPPRVESTYTVEPGDILVMVRELNTRAETYHRTGGIHSAALYANGELVCFSEDVGRHNAVDKVVGGGLLKAVDFGTCVLVTSGRQPADMVLKAARVGIPVTVSTSGPIHSGVLAAGKTEVTLICFARGERMNIYTRTDRVKVNSAELHSRAPRTI